MSIAYFDTFSGASGDMIVAALIDAGLSLDALRAELGKLPLGGYAVSAVRTTKNGLACTRFTVEVGHEHHPHHRTFDDIRSIIGGSGLEAPLQERVMRVFTRLAEAEAKVHGEPVEKVHFHEVGAVDSIIDIVGAVVGLHLLGVKTIVSGPLRFGTGTVKTQHGILPLPAPATVELSRGFPVEFAGIEGELTTPTGAAILTALADSFAPPPPMRIIRVGTGGGTMDLRGRANVLRIIIGETDDGAADRVTILEANIDDATAEVIGYATEALFVAGALDVFAVPIQMKKSRPGVILSVIGRPEDREKLEEVLLRETTTFGIRRREELRTKLNRRFIEVDFFGTKVRVKLGLRGGRVVTVSPEYEDCARVARETGIPLRGVYDEVRRLSARLTSEPDTGDGQ